MKTLDLEQAQDWMLKDVLKLVADGDCLILTEKGAERYVVGPMDDLEEEALSLSSNKEFMAYLESSKKRGDREGSILLNEAIRRLGT